MESGRTFPFQRLSGTHRAIGRQHGEAFAELVRQHRDLALSRLGERSGLTRDSALAAALRYRSFVRQHAAFLDEEVQGVADGAGISLAEAYLLQLRAELAVPVGASAAVAAPQAPRAAAPDRAVVLSSDDGDECTTFAVLGEATADGGPLAGQNADLPAFYAQLGVVVEIVPADQPRVLMLTPAGQVSYIGLNDRGLGCFANFLTCDGWREGFPRYFLSRLALTHETVEQVVAAVRAVPRASSRNLIMVDTHGGAADLETTATLDARLDPRDGLLAHANHYTDASLLAEERSSASNVANSKVRQARMEALLAEHRGRLSAEVMQTILRDRAGYPDTLCRMPGDGATDTITFASVIAEPARGQLHVAVGPPNQHPYRTHAFSN